MGNDAMSRDVGNGRWSEGAAPRFTLTVQVDGRPESERLAQVVRRAPSGGSGPDLISLVPHGAERRNENAAWGCRGTLVALPGAVGCVIGPTLVTLPLRGELALLHGQLAQADRSAHTSTVGNTPAAAMAEIMEYRVDSPQWLHPSAPTGGMTDEDDPMHRAAVGDAVGDVVMEAALLELRSRVARLEGALVGQLTARLDSRLNQLTTRREMQDVAEDVTAALAAVSAVQASLEQRQMHERHQQEEQEAWREEMLQEMRSYRRQVETLAQDSEVLKAELGQRWWQVWQRWKM